MSKSICLYRCREMARNNNAFSLGPMLEKEKFAANGGNYADWLNALYLKQARTERYEITKQLWECKMAEGSSISEHVIKLVGYAQRLSALGFAIPTTLGTDILLASLPRLTKDLS